MGTFSDLVFEKRVAFKMIFVSLSVKPCFKVNNKPMQTRTTSHWSQLSWSLFEGQIIRLNFDKPKQFPTERWTMKSNGLLNSLSVKYNERLSLFNNIYIHLHFPRGRTWAFLSWIRQQGKRRKHA